MRILALLVLLTPLTAAAQTALNVNPGYWEVTSFVHLPTGNLGPNVTHACIQASDLSHPTKLVDTPHCTTTLTKSTSTSADMTTTCQMPNESINGTLHLEVVSATSVSAKAHMQANDNGNNVSVTAEYKGRWLSAKCSATP